MCNRRQACRLITLGLLGSLIGCDDRQSPTGPSPIEVEVVPDFIGRVYTPGRSGRSIVSAVPDAQVTVLDGPESGSSFVTDSEGQFRIPELDTDRVMVRVEKTGFLTKEATIYRSALTFPPGDNRYAGHRNSAGDMQLIPGNVLIGLPWPEPFRFVQQNNRGFIHAYGKRIEVDSDLLLVNFSWPLPACGVYGSGVITVANLGGLGCIAHEVAHSHQAAHTWHHLGHTYVPDWDQTPEGIAFQQAREKDLAEHGPDDWLPEPYLVRFLHENAAEIMGWWLTPNRERRVRECCPNRAAWADEWAEKPIG